MFNAPVFSSLRHKNYRLFWFGSFLSEVGNQMQVVAINWQIYELTHSALSLGLVGLASFLPIPIFSLLGGLVADKADRKHLLIYCQIFQSLIALGLTIATQLNRTTPLLIYLAISLSFVARTFQAPARQAIIPQLVPAADFMNAVSLNTMVRQASIVVGPAIAGFIIEFGGVRSVYFINAISYILLIGALLPISIVASPTRHLVTFSFRSVLEGIHFVRRSQILYSTMLLDFLANFFASATTMLPIFAQDVLQQGAGGLGIMYSAPSIGAILAGLAIASKTNLRYPGRVILVGVLIYGGATIAFGLSNFYIFSLFCLALVGAGDMISTVLRNTLRQLITPNELRGRMVSVNMIFIQGGPQLGEIEAGLVAAAFGAPFSVVIGGIGAVVSALAVFLFMPMLRTYRTGAVPSPGLPERHSGVPPPIGDPANSAE